MSDQHELTISTVIDAHPAIVWQAWTSPELFEQWWAPSPLKTRLLAMDLQPGGAFDTEMTMADDSKVASHGCFLEVVPYSRIVFTDAMTAGYVPAAEAFFTVIITMAAHVKGNRTSTEYHARVLHKNAADKERHMEMGFTEGWSICLKQLKALAEAPEPCEHMV